MAKLHNKTRITVLNGVNELFDIINGDLFPGDFVANEITWDGKDNNGNILPNGTYTIVIDPVKGDEWSGRFPSVTKVTIMDSAVEDIVISPNVNGNYFMVYGSAEENMTESVEVYITSKNKKDGFNETYTAEIKPGMWSVDVWLPEYEEVQITALKINKVPKEAKDGEGNPVLDENGCPVIVYEEEEIELGPINVLKHTLRPYDKLPKMAAYYYGNENEHTRIIEDNDLIPPYVLGIGSNLLVFDPEKDGEPPISEFADPEKMDEKCGIIDLLSGDTIFSEDPVNLATGNFIYSYEDITIDGSFPISFNRFYNSRDEYYGDLGANWHHNWEYRLQDMGDGTVKIISYDGNRQTYTLMTNGKYESPTGIYTKLEKHLDQTYTLTMENKWEYDFNERGELVKITDTNGNSTKLRYEGMLLREIRNDSGYLLIQYYNDGRIREISDNTGRHIAYNYDGDDLVSYADPEGNTIEYEYDSERRMTRIISPLKDGSVTNIYDNKGRVIEQTLADGNTMYFEYDEANRTTTLTERDGTKTIYKYDEKFRITESIYPDGAIKVTFNEKGDKTSFTDKKGNTYEYEYDDYGNVTLAKDPLGNITRYTYDEFHNITSVKYQDGTIYEYTYDNKGNLTKSKDPMNRTTEIIYNNKGLPEKIIQPDQSFIRMEYDAKGNVKATVDPLGNKTEYEYDSLNRVNKVIDSLGNGTKYEYTDTGKIRKVTDALGNSGTFVYNKNGRLKEAWDQNGNITKYIYDEADQLKQIIDPLKGVTRFDYDAKGNINEAIDANGNKTTYIYDKLDRLISVTDPEGYTYEYQYDPNGNMTKAIDPLGNVTEYKYDELNRLTHTIDANKEITRYEYDVLGRIKKTINPLNHTVEYNYYKDGKVKEIKDQMGNITSFTYNDLGLLETVTEPNGAVTEYKYNSLGNTTEIKDPLGEVTKYEYDKNNNVSKVIDPLGNITRYTYDKLNRVETITDALGNTKEYTYTKMGQVASITDENGNTEWFSYDALGNLIEVTDALGNTTEYVYDKIGNLTEVHAYRGVTEETLSQMTSQMLTTRQFSQTVVEEVYEEEVLEEEQEEEIIIELETRKEEETVAQAVYNTFAYTGMEYQPTYYKYDKRGLVTEIKDAEGKVKVYEYDANGNLIKVKDKDGYITTYQYDPLNMIKKINFNGEKQIEYEYNQIGQLIQMKNWLGITDLELDPLGRILKVTDYENKEIEYTWTNTGEKESITYPDGSKVYYEYDKLGRLTKVEDEYGKITTYRYDELSNLIERVLPNGSTTQYKYNQISNITELKEIDPLGRITDTLRYEYDRAGNKTKAYKNRSDLDEEKEEGEEREVITYAYDAIDQLIEVTRNNETKKYFYDTLGNRIRLEEWNIDQVEEAINYEYDSLNRLIRTYEDIEEDEGKQYRYDNRGNLTQERSGGKIFNKYEYDETNSLVKVINKHGDQTKYTYDGFGNRIKTIIDLNHPGGGNRPDKDDNGNNGNNGNAYGHENGNNGNAYGHENGNNGNAYGHENGNNGNPKPGWKHQDKRQIMEQNFVVDITSPYNNVLMIYGDHYQIQRYTYGIDRISMDMWMLDDYDNGWIPSTRDTHLKEDPERLYYLHDELGSTTKVIGENGKTSAHYNYDEFGRPLSSRKFDQNWPGPDNTFGYTGYQYDVSSDLYYAQARYYNAEIGRFISEDPWKGTIVEPNTMNPYPYVLNNPLKYVDPLGLNPDRMLIMVDDGGGSKSTPAPIVNTKSKKNVVSQVKNEVVKKEISGASDWSCKVANDRLYSSNVVALSSGSITSFPTADPGLDILKDIGTKILGFGSKLTGAIKSASPWAIGGIIVFTPEKAGETDEDLKNDEAFQQWLLKSEAKNEEKNSKSISPGKDHPYNPGVPTEKEGFTAPKKWDGKKVKTKDGQYGYPDKKGNVWVPTNLGNAHGGSHWDVQHPDGTHTNVYPK